MADPFAGRITELNDCSRVRGEYVLYWMQQSQRASWNHALEYAVRMANESGLPTVVAFGLTSDYPEATLRHYRFMAEGLVETAQTIRERGLSFVLRHGSPPEVALSLAKEASVVVCDRGYLRHQRQWRTTVAREAPCPVIEVESDLVVPVEAASLKQEYAARTIRPKIHRVLGEFLIPLPETLVDVAAGSSLPRGVETGSPEEVLSGLDIGEEPGPVSEYFTGGESQARKRLRNFLATRLRRYEDERNEPGLDVSSGLSPYLHFGQISALEIALECGAQDFAAQLADGKGQMKHTPGSVGIRVDDDAVTSARDAFLEELIVRRELAFNYVWQNPNYDSYDGLPDWPKRTLAEHKTDKRPYLYTAGELEEYQTHDEYWNDAMREMVVTGYMHNYMRMYWAKKIIEWSETPEIAFDRTLDLNNRFFLDGRDPNSYANVGWAFGLHDRPWTERPVFGKVRYMNANGLKRKFDMESYSQKVNRLADLAR